MLAGKAGVGRMTRGDRLGPGGEPPEGSARAWLALAGAVAAAVALGATELVAGLLRGTPSLVQSVATVVIDSAPIGLVRAAIATLGTRDKPVLVGGVVVLSLAFGAGLALASTRRRWVAAAGLAAFAAVGAWAGARPPGVEPWRPLVAALAGLAAGTAALAILRRPLPRPSAEAPASAVPPAASAAGAATRRSFLAAAGSLLVVGAAAGTGGRLLQARARATARAGVVLPGPAGAPAGPGAALDVPGLSPFITPNRDFYRVDVATTPPLVDPSGWRLRIGGMVERPIELSYRELLAMPMEEHDITLVCVSNELGGDLAGNARWRGVRLDELLRRAGPRPGATQVVGRSVDGFTAGFPTRLALDGRDALVAIGMNGEPLPDAHGFPARLVVPGLYGYASACKWLQEIRLTTFDGFDAYWVERGWAKEGPMKTMARIDTPARGRRLRPGRVAVAGVAWASHTGVSKVEVQVDGRHWTPARLGPGERDTWRQWVLDWDATPGTHTIRARATDGAGRPQTSAVADSYPSGATGLHTIDVTVRA
jgi:DMSO/TMAO reductase YedYZ molybdopterin-dependent catalytic subunit